PAYSLTDAIEEEIRSLVKDDVLEKVESSDWATPIVVVPKSNNRVRICGDFKVTVNKNIRVDRHPMPRVEDIFNKLQGGLTFTTIDIRQAYLNIVMAEEDREMLTVSTHIGLYRFKRLPYGISSAPAIWQRTIEN